MPVGPNLSTEMDISETKYEQEREKHGVFFAGGELGR